MPSSKPDLLVDHGNSRIKWALSEGGTWVSGDPIRVQGEETDFSLLKGIETPQRILVSNSAGPQALACLEDFCEGQWHLKPETLGAKAVQCDVTNSYADPQSLGSDRWLAMIAARQLCKGPLAVIDCGTAITCDALSAEGVFLGGVISAGPETAAQALLSKAAHLDLDEMRYAGVTNTDTSSAVGSGSLVFAVGGIERVLTELRARLGEEFQVLMTGGWAETLTPLMTVDAAVYPDLVLQGIQIVAGQEA